MTFTLSFFRVWGACGVKVRAVAPAMALPSAYHRYVKLVPFGQAPGAAVSLCPTLTVPETVGTAVARAPALTITAWLVAKLDS